MGLTAYNKNEASKKIKACLLMPSLQYCSRDHYSMWAIHLQVHGGTEEPNDYSNSGCAQAKKKKNGQLSGRGFLFFVIIFTSDTIIESFHEKAT